MYYVYVLKSLKDGRNYIGYTTDIQNRLFAHNNWKNPSTRNRRPFVLIHQEALRDKKEAIFREKQIKRYKGGEALQKLISMSFGPIV